MSDDLAGRETRTSYTLMTGDYIDKQNAIDFVPFSFCVFVCVCWVQFSRGNSP